MHKIFFPENLKKILGFTTLIVIWPLLCSTIVGILTFMSMMIFMPSWVAWKNFYNLGVKLHLLQSWCDIEKKKKKKSMTLPFGAVFSCVGHFCKHVSIRYGIMTLVKILCYILLNEALLNYVIFPIAGNPCQRNVASKYLINPNYSSLQANEIAFINSLEAQNKRLDIMTKYQESEARLQDIQVITIVLPGSAVAQW